MKDIGFSRLPKSLVIILLILFSSAALIWFYQDTFLTFIHFVRDRQAVVAFIDRLGFLGPLALGALLALQVLVPTLPSEPMMIAGAYAYGFAAGFLISWVVSVAASQAVFYLARFAGRPVVERFVPARALEKWTQKAAQKGTIFFLLAFVIPPIPSDIMTYVAGLSAIGGRRFLLANLVGRLPMVFFYTLVGASGFSITPRLIAALTITGLLMLAAWWFFIMRQRPSPKVIARRPSMIYPKHAQDTPFYDSHRRMRASVQGRSWIRI